MENGRNANNGASVGGGSEGYRPPTTDDVVIAAAGVSVADSVRTQEPVERMLSLTHQAHAPVYDAPGAVRVSMAMRC